MWVGDELATAGQPDEAELGLLRAHGFEAVINLGLLDPEYCLPDEAGGVANEVLSAFMQRVRELRGRRAPET